MSNENLQTSQSEQLVLEEIKLIADKLSSFSREDQNKIILGVFGNVLKERRNIIREKKEEIESVDKDMEDLRSQIVNINSKVIQNERSEP